MVKQPPQRHLHAPSLSNLILFPCLIIWPLRATASPKAAHSGGSQTDSDREEVLDLLPPDLEEFECVRFRFASSGPSPTAVGAAAAAAAGVSAAAAGVSAAATMIMPGFQSCPHDALN